MKKRIAVLGATGSIGKNSLDVISRNRDDFEIVLLSAHNNRHGLEAISADFPGALCVLSGDGLSGERGGKEKLLDAIKEARPDRTVNGISGGAGLEPSLAAIECGSALALANKETRVMAGPLVFRLAKEKNVKIIPVDSEHSAVFHLIEAHCRDKGENILEEIILTASGGPFRKLSAREMANVSPQAALAHPTWKMGPKISIDSASMANKGLEIIEAAALFNMPPEKIKVVIHPQSVVHSMLRLSSGVIYAQLSRPDMRHPIQDALYWPEAARSGFEPLNFDSLTLEFEKPDLQKFPMLGLAWEAAGRGGLYPCAYNAANEAAVAGFLKSRIGFLDIPEITRYVLEGDMVCGRDDTPELDLILKADADARARAVSYIEKHS
jgi:1-deoxy-D-xylulose-5-phosphate reductoisomerase